MIKEASWQQFREEQLAAQVAASEQAAPISDLFEWLSQKKLPRRTFKTPMVERVRAPRKDE